MRHDQPFGRGCPVVFNSDVRTGDYNHQNQAPFAREEHDENEYECECSRQRDRECECSRQRDCECECEMNAARKWTDDVCNPNDARPAGMVYHMPHGLHHMYEPGYALHAGTLFAELNKPMEDCGADSRTAGTRQQATAFAAWEMRLYLCTHPKDQHALHLYRQLCQQTEQPNYACTFAPCTAGRGTWDWVDDPWPWEYAANCDRRG